MSKFKKERKLDKESKMKDFKTNEIEVLLGPNGQTKGALAPGTKSTPFVQ